ncbi:hypothetical protein AWJ14_18290 [Hoeflea olei]|uniref:Transposase DDE domain-containing protein n=2 Tax=Hoeflea olei TaxID=1480615 RepID=A0A1C1YYG6_9HYPH|nr:hypothetical protein AWJ14_18290 [Hoeflea olei]
MLCILMIRLRPVPIRRFRRGIRRYFFKAPCRGRARIERRMEKFKRFALRCERFARKIRSSVAIAAAFILIKSGRKN